MTEFFICFISSIRYEAQEITTQRLLFSDDDHDRVRGKSNVPRAPVTTDYIGSMNVGEFCHRATVIHNKRHVSALDDFDTAREL
ncbi:Uncharacterised protein [Chlamydia trachomatis]|nr:Uncharacterised protein [Chlamydia trachomatis]